MPAQLPFLTCVSSSEPVATAPIVAQHVSPRHCAARVSDARPPRALTGASRVRSSRRAAALAGFAAACLSACGGSGATTSSLTLQRHMDFFSHESHLAQVIDPQMFTSAPGAAAGTGPQGVVHVAGYAPVSESATPTTPLFNADGVALGVTLGEWEAASGTVTLTCSSGADTVAAHLAHLIPGGVYSLFVVHLHAAANAARFTPLGSTNTATSASDGALTITSKVAPCLSSGEAVLVVWHSDGSAHGASPGLIGVTQHNNLIAALPST